MRDLFINLLEKVINVIVVIVAFAIVIGALAALFVPTMHEGMAGAGANPGARVLMSLAILVGGGLYLIVVAGFMYLGLGIYQNTKRTTELLEQRG